MKRILVVDDDNNLADLIADFCADAGFETMVVTDPAAALDTAIHWQPDLISLDIEMPGMDGIELLSRLKKTPETRHTPVLILSIVAQKAREEGHLAGADAVFQKPIRFSTFIEKLKEFLPNVETANR